MAFDDLLASMNASCLSVMGEEFTYTRVASSPEDGTGSFTGIRDTGAEEEDEAPGADSTYLRIWGAAAVAALGLLKGDEVATATTVYTIVDINQDAGGGVWLVLRKARGVFS